MLQLAAVIVKGRQKNTPFSIIFCKTVNDIVSLLTYILMKLGNSGLYVDGEGPIHERCLLGVTIRRLLNLTKIV